MTDSQDKYPWEHDDSLLGPAVPQEDATSADADLAEPLSPFLGGDGPLSIEDQHAFSAEDAPAAGIEDEIPWLEELQPEPAPTGYDDLGAHAGGSDPEPELPAMEAFAPEPATEHPVEKLPELQHASSAPGGGLGTVAGEVADRLEGIARSLRGGDPSRLLTDASDPLEMLILGYVLGRSNAGRGGR